MLYKQEFPNLIPGSAHTSASRVPACVIFDNLCEQFVPLVA